MGRPAGWRGAVLGAAAFLAACGGTTSFSGGDGNVRNVAFEGTTVTARAVVVAADVDGDRRTDLVGITRDGRGETKCWRNRGDGTYGDATEAWASLPGVRALRADAEVRDDAALESDLGFHRADCPELSGLPYALLHLGDGAGAPLEPPVLEGIRPPSGDARSLVLLEGRALAAQGETTTVAFGGVPARVPFAFPDRVIAVVPDGLGLGPVSVTLARGGVPAGSASFTVEAASVPRIDSVEPTTLAPRTIAVVRGEDLGTPLDEVAATFGGVPAERLLALDEVLFVEVPAGAVSGPLVVTVGGASSAPFDVTIGALPTPVVTALLPAAASPGSLVRIEGTDLAVLGEGTAVRFGGVAAALFRVAPDAVTAIVPTGAAHGDVVVTVGGRASVGRPFDVVARGMPTIVSLSMTTVSRGDLLQVRGTDLYDLSSWRPGALPPFPLFGDLEVSIGSAAAWLAWPTHEGLELIVPSGAPLGSTSVVVRHSGLSSNAFPLTVEAP